LPAEGRRATPPAMLRDRDHARDRAERELHGDAALAVQSRRRDRTPPRRNRVHRARSERRAPQAGSFCLSQPVRAKSGLALPRVSLVSSVRPACERALASSTGTDVTWLAIGPSGLSRRLRRLRTHRRTREQPPESLHGRDTDRLSGECGASICFSCSAFAPAPSYPSRRSVLKRQILRQHPELALEVHGDPSGRVAPGNPPVRRDGCPVREARPGTGQP
jgi:hypothetical protein